MSETPLNTMLLQQLLQQMIHVREDIGGINEQLKAGSEKHRQFTEQLDMIDRRTDIIEDKTVSIERRTAKVEEILTPVDGNNTLVGRVTELELFRGKFAAVVSIGVGAVMFVWYGFSWLISHWKELFDIVSGNWKH